MESTEGSIEFLPKEGFEHMIKALENITSDLKKHAAEAIRLEGQVNLLTSDHETQTLAVHLAGIRTRIATLLSQAENGRLLIADAQQIQIRKQQELSEYQILLTEIEAWLETVKTTISTYKLTDETSIENHIRHCETLNKELSEKEKKLKDLSRICREFEKYPDLHGLVIALLEQLRILTEIFEEQKTIITTRISVCNKQLEEIRAKPPTPDLSLENTLDSTSMPIEEIPVHADVKHVTQEFLAREAVAKASATIETQTGRSLSSPVEEPVTKDFTVTYNEPVDAQIQTQMSQPSSEAEQAQHKQTITISKRTSGGQETIHIATKPMIPDPQPVVEEPDDVLVEANYRKRPESETGLTELNITNVGSNQPFETVFVEPDETTTEVIVDADGTKRIIVKKLHRTVVRHQQSSQQQQFSTLSTLTEGDVPISQSFSQITLQGQQSATTVAKGDGSRATLTSHQYGGKVISGAPGGEIDVHEYQTEPETHFSVVGPTLKPEEVEVQGIKLHEGDITFINDENNQLIPAGQSHIEGNAIHTSSSSVRAVVQQVTRRIIRKTRRIIRRTVIIDGKEHVTEEVVEEPEEVEVTEEGIPRVSINVTRTENGKVVTEQQFGEEPITVHPDVSVTQKVTSVVLDSDGRPVEKVPETIKIVTQPEERYVVALQPEIAPQVTEPVEVVSEGSKKSSGSIIADFINNEKLAISLIESSEVAEAPRVDAAHPDVVMEGEIAQDNGLKESIKQMISVEIGAPHPTEVDVKRTETPSTKEVPASESTERPVIKFTSDSAVTVSEIDIESPQRSVDSTTFTIEKHSLVAEPHLPETKIDIQPTEAVIETLFSRVDEAETVKDDSGSEIKKITETKISSVQPVIGDSQETSKKPKELEHQETPTEDHTIISKTPEFEETVVTETFKTEQPSSPEVGKETTESVIVQATITGTLGVEETPLVTSVSEKPTRKTPENEYIEGGIEGTTVVLTSITEKPASKTPETAVNEKPPVDNAEEIIVVPQTVTSKTPDIEKSAKPRIPGTGKSEIAEKPSSADIGKEEIIVPPTIIRKTPETDEIKREETVIETSIVKQVSLPEVKQTMMNIEKVGVEGINANVIKEKIPSLLSLTHDFISSEKRHSPGFIREKQTDTDSAVTQKEDDSETTEVSELPKSQTLPEVKHEEISDPNEEMKIEVEKKVPSPEVAPMQITEDTRNSISQTQVVSESKLTLEPIQMSSETVEIVDEPNLESKEITTHTTISTPVSKVTEIIESEVAKTPSFKEMTIQETELVTSVASLPSGNVEMFLSIEEQRPHITILSQSSKKVYSEPEKVTAQFNMTDFLESERKATSPFSKTIEDFGTEIETVEKAKETFEEKIEEQSPDESIKSKEPSPIQIPESIVDDEKIVQSSPKEEIVFTEILKPRDAGQEVNIVLSLEEKYDDATIATPKLSVAMKIEEDIDHVAPAEILRKDIHVQLPTIMSEKIETTTVTVSSLEPKLSVDHKETKTPSDIDHGGRGSKKKKKHKEMKSPTPVLKETQEEIVKENLDASAVEEKLALKVDVVEQKPDKPEDPVIDKMPEDNVNIEKKTPEKQEDSIVEEESDKENMVDGKPESVITSLAESTDISVPEDSLRSETPKPTVVIFESVTESEEDISQGKDTGYEADKTTVDESLADEDDAEKKKRRKKKRRQKVKVKESEESNVPKSAYESSPVGHSVPLTDEEVPKRMEDKPEETKKSKKRKNKGKRKQSESELESENTIFEARDEEIVSPNESYHTISTPSELGTVKIIEECSLNRPYSESPRNLTSEIVTTVPVLEAIVTQETISQTSPLKEVTSQFLEQEVRCIEKSPEPIPEISKEQVSVQTSPEIPKETAEISMQTIEEPKPVEVTKPEIQESSTQIEISTTEIVTQTTPVAKSPEDKIFRDTIETSIQTVSPIRTEVTEEYAQTVTPEVVELSRIDSAMQTKVESHEEYAQTKSPEKIVTSEIASQIQPDLTECALQTSPEPSAPPLEEFEEFTRLIEPMKKVETAEIVTQTSPVVITGVGDLYTPSPTPSPSVSEQYEIHVEALVTVPPDGSESMSEKIDSEPLEISKEVRESQILVRSESETPVVTAEWKTDTESDGSPEEFDVQVSVGGVTVDKHSFVTSFIDSERNDDIPAKSKRKRHKKSKNVTKDSEPRIEKNLLAEFQRQNTVQDTLDPKVLYSDVARRSRSSSPVRQGETINESHKKVPNVADGTQLDDQSTSIGSPTKSDETTVEEKLPQKSILTERIKVTAGVPVKDITEVKTVITEQRIAKKAEDKVDEDAISKVPENHQTEVVSKVLTDLDRNKIKKITETKKPKEFDLEEQTTTVNISITVPPESETTSPELMIISKDILTTRGESTEPATFTVDSILTEAKLTNPDLVPKSHVEEALLVKSGVTREPNRIVSTVEFLETEKIQSELDDRKTVVISDKPMETPLQASEQTPKIHTQSQPEERKPKQGATKPKTKGRHVSSVTIEEVESPTIIPDTPLTPASDAGPLSPPDYSTTVWKEPSHKDVTQTFIHAESQNPVALKEVNIKWNQTLALERFKNLQNAKKTTHLSDVLYLATLNEIITDETVEQRNYNIQENLVVLQNAVEKRDVVVIQQTIITTVETITTWLETIEYRIYVNRQQTSEGPSRERVQEFNDLRQEIANIETKVEQLQTVMSQTDNIYNEDDRQRMKSYIDSLQQQVRVIEEVTQENEQLAAGDLRRWNEFINGVTNVSGLVRELKRQLSELKDSDASPQTKLSELDQLEICNRGHMMKVANLVASAKSLMRDFPTKEIPRDVYVSNELTKQIEQQIAIEREKAYQFLSLADDYEQTLKEFSQIILIAEALVESPITVRNLEHLEDEMQNHRKFFVNLSHCRAILESLEENLDSETRAIHTQLHQNLYERAKVILDKSTGRFQLMSLAASRWTVLEQSTREEMRWLQVAQQRVPDLNNVTSSDYDRFIDLFNSLAADIDYHHAKLSHLNCVAEKLQELVYCSGLEQAYAESLEIIQKLEDDVQHNLERLLAFRDTWMAYNMLSDRVECWLKGAEMQLMKIEVPSGPRGHLRQFWELKAQHEVHNIVRMNASNALEKSLQIVPVSDEMFQRRSNSELNTQWQEVSKRISDIEGSILDTISATDVPVNEKLAFLEQELQDLNTDVRDLKGIIKTEEELNLYVERLQIMSTRLETIQNELSRLGLLSANESDKVGSLLALSKQLEIIIVEELEGGILVKERLQAIQKGLDRVRRKHSDLNKDLDQCESAEKLGSDSIERAVHECCEVGEELVTLWQDLMSIRQMLHTLPMRLKVTVSPVTIEKDISKLQDDHTALEKKCGQILALLRSRLALWQRFERQLEMVQQSVQEADFMVELLTVQGKVDYERLRKATERLESVSGDLVSRETLVAELKNAAKPLADSCAPEVSAKIEAAVKEAVTAYENTCSNLKELCTKYHHAADLWKQYKEASDLVKEWIENPMESVENLEPDEAIEKVKVCEESLAAHTRRLSDLQQLVSGIASAVGLDAKSLLGGEVQALGKRLEDVRESLTALADVAEAKAKAKNDAQKEINGTRIYLDSVQQSINSLDSTDTDDTNNEEKLLVLRDHLLALSKAEGQIQQIKNKTVEVSTTKTETSVLEILELWQQVFRETFQQYHRLSTRLVKNEDGAAALKLWQEYLMNVQQFLQGTIPGDYHSLSDHQHLCQIHQNLLTTQQNVLKPDEKKDSQLASGLVESTVMEQFNSLTNLHNETLSSIMDRHSEVQKRLNAWDKYKQDQNKLLNWLKAIEKEREHMQLRYMHIRRIPKLLSLIQNLLDKIPQGEDQAENLQKQQNLLLQFCDDALATSIRMEHVAIKQRISNLQAGLETWKEFLERITLLVKSYENRVEKVQKVLDDVQQAVEISSNFETSHTWVSNKLQVLQMTRDRLNTSKKDLEQLALTQEQLKECLSPSDMKTVNQRIWLLWNQYGDLDHQMATLCHQLEDKLGVRSMFESRHAKFIAWVNELEHRLDKDYDDSSTPMDPKELLRKLETELQAEMALKEREYSWLLKTGKEIVDSCGDEYADVTARQIFQTRTEEVSERWNRLESIGKSRFNKINDALQTILQLEERIAKMRAWLSQIEVQLAKPLVFEASTQDVIDRKQQDHEKLKKSIENESGNVGELLNLCELVLNDPEVMKSNFPVDNMSRAVTSLEKRWKSVCGQSAERKRKINFIWKLLQDVAKLSGEQDKWLAKKEHSLKELDKPADSLGREEIQQLIYVVENEIKDIESRTPAFQILCHTYSKLVTAPGIEPANIKELTSKARVIVVRWENLMPKAQALLQRLQNELTPFKEFSLAHEDAIVALTKLDAQITELQHLSPPDKVSPVDRLKKLQSIERKLTSQTPNLETADRLGLQIMKKSSKKEVEEIQEMIDEYQILCRNLHERITYIKTEIKKEKPQKPLEVDESVQVETLKFERDTAVQVNTLPPQLQRMTSISAKDAYLVELEAALVECRTNIESLEVAVHKEIPKQGSSELPTSSKKISRMSARCQASTELVKHLHDLLINECEATEIEACGEEVFELIERYKNLVVLAKEKEQKLRELSEAGRILCPLCTKRNWAQLDNDLWRLEKWLQVAEGTQKSQKNPPSNIEHLEDVVQDHREFLLDLDSHKSIVRSLNIVGTHLADHTEDTTKADELRSRLEADNKRWDVICRHATDWQVNLQWALMNNQQFHTIIAELCAWLETNEKKIRASEPVDLTAPLETVEAKYQRFLELRAELERCEPRVMSLQEAANQLLREEAPEGAGTIYRRLTELRLKLQSLIKLTGVYTLKLGAVLGRDPNEIGTLESSGQSAGIQSLSYDPLDRPSGDLPSASTPDDTSHNGSEDEEEINTSVLRRGCRFLGRVVRASVPIQALMLLMLGAASLVPFTEDDYSCSLVNTIANSLTPTLRYNDGPPPI
nr:nesprin-1-like isoform X2 [Leptinotarsa decemlineata]